MPDSTSAWLLGMLLLSVRLVPVVVLSPLLSSYGVPAFVRIALTFMLAVSALAGRPPTAQALQWLYEPTRFMVTLLAELALGALMGLALQIALAAFAVAGRLMDVQVGFGLASIFDPTTRASSSVLGAFLGLVAVMIFITSGAHLELARLVAASVDVFPLGHVPALDNPMRVLQAGGLMFSLGLSIAAPVALTLLLVDIAMGVISRTMPQLNVLMLGIPVKVGVAYLVLLSAMPAVISIAGQGFVRSARAMGVL